MSTPISSAPFVIADNAAQEIELTMREYIGITCLDHMPAQYAPSGNKLPPCQKLVRIGLFFDGTNNNKYRDEPNREHTNVVKLFNAHKDIKGEKDLRNSSCFRFYIPGVGTRFPENQEWKETQEGKAMGKGGQARILYGILRVYDAVYRSFNEGTPLYEEREITAKLKKYERDVEQNYDKEYTHYVRRQKWFTELREELNDKLQAARKIIIQPRIPQIRVAVAGTRRPPISCGMTKWGQSMFISSRAIKYVLFPRIPGPQVRFTRYLEIPLFHHRRNNNEHTYLLRAFPA